MMLTEQALVLATPDGRRAATRYALGAVLVLLIFISAMVFFGRAISLPAEPSLSATLDIVLGLVLILIAVAIHLIRRSDRSEKDADQVQLEPQKRQVFGTRGALAVGAFSMTTNFTTLALMIPAAKMIAASGEILPARALLVAVLVVLASTPAWLPVVLVGLAPGPAESFLDGVGSFIERRGRTLVVVAIALLGAFLLVRGAVHYAGL